MHASLRRTAIGALLGFIALSLPHGVFAAGEKILIFKDSLSYNGHTAAINAAMNLLKGWQAANGFTIDSTKTFDSFTPENLAKYDAVIFMMPERATKANPGTGISDTMSAEQDSAFKNWVLTGKGYIGVHCDTRQNPNWPWWYKEFVGSTYVGDVGPVSSTYHVTDPNSLLTQGIPASFTASEQIRVDSLFFTEADTNYKVLIKGDIADYVKNNTTANPILKPWTNSSTVVPWMPFFPFVYLHNYQGARMFHLAPGHNATTWTTTNSNWNKVFLSGVLYALNRPGYGSTGVASKASPTRYVLNAKEHALNFGIPKREHVVIQVYSLKGQRIKTIADRNYGAGNYSVTIPADLQSSVFLLDFKAGKYHRTLKIAPGVGSDAG
jgi:type 1 glutamine amidotransferase